MDLHVRRLSNLRSLVDAELTGSELIELMRELFPIAAASPAMDRGGVAISAMQLMC